MVMNCIFIESESQLTPLAEAFAAPGYVAFDTEFIRETTYHPRFCLLQLCVDGRVFLVDALSLRNAEPVIRALIGARCPVICHAGREDMEILGDLARKYGFGGFSPASYFDLQVAEAFLNGESGVGLGALAERRLGVVMSKSETRSDWARRPLSDEQIEYAIEDVVYLKRLYDGFAAEMAEKPLAARFLREELAEEARRRAGAGGAEAAYLKLKGTGRFGDRKLRAAHALCTLRQRVCEFEDMPLTFFLRNNVLVKIAETGAASPAALLECGAGGRTVRKYGDAILRALREAEEDATGPVLRTYDSVNRLPGVSPARKELEAFLRAKAEELGAARDLLASRRLVDDFIYNVVYGGGGPALLERGWRAEWLGSLDGFRAKIREAAGI